MRSNRVLLPLMMAMLWLAGCQPDGGAGPLSDYQTPDPLVLRTPEAPVPVPDVTLVGERASAAPQACFAIAGLCCMSVIATAQISVPPNSASSP